MIRQYFIAVILLFGFKANAQEVRMGLVLGGNVYQKVSLDLASHTPENSYWTYNEPREGEGIVNKNGVFNAFHLGGVFNFSYKRWSLFAEPQFYYQRSVIKFEKPYYTERLLGKRAFRMPIYITYKFFKKERSLYAIGGLTFNKENNTDIQFPGTSYYVGGDKAYEYFSIDPSDEWEVVTFDYGDDHFENLLYDNRPYWTYIFGLGRNFGRFNLSARYHRKFDITDHFIEAKIWQVDISLGILILSSKDFTKKHFLYVE